MKSSTNICQIPRWGGRGYKWPTLTELHQHVFGCPHGGAHSAHGDVEACAKCFYEIIRLGHLQSPTGKLLRVANCIASNQPPLLEIWVRVQASKLPLKMA